jgi:hypothetical protein
MLPSDRHSSHAIRAVMTGMRETRAALTAGSVSLWLATRHASWSRARGGGGQGDGLLIAYFLRMAIGIWRAQARLSSRPS